MAARFSVSHSARAQCLARVTSTALGPGDVDGENVMNKK